jgi:hypothetical protein
MAWYLSTRSSVPEWPTEEISEAFATNGEKWDQRLDDWLDHMHDALVEFRRGSDKKRAGGPSLKTADSSTVFDSHRNCRQGARLMQIEALRCERVGNYEQAWNWYRSMLRCSIHAENSGGLVCKLVGGVIREMTYPGIVRWAENPLLTAERLFASRNELTNKASERTPLFEVAKANYLMMLNDCKRPDYPDVIIDGNGRWAVVYNAVPMSFKRALLWMVGQPELRLRLDRQFLINCADQLDKRLPLRRKSFISRGHLVFELDPRVQTSGQLDPGRLNRVNHDPLIHLGDSCWAVREVFDAGCRHEDAQLAAVKVVLAAQEYQRIHGEFPEALQQLVPEFLDVVPFDPMDASGAALRYRRDENGEAVVWSIGRDEKDDDGDVGEFGEHCDTGYRIRLKSRNIDQSTESGSITE